MDKSNSLFRAMSNSAPRKYKKSYTLCYPGEVPRIAYAVKTGIVRAYTIDRSGEEHTIAFYGPGDLLPPEWIFGITKVSLYYYDCFLDTDLYVQPLDEVTLLLKSPEHKEAMMRLYLRRYIESTMHISALEHGNAEEKIVTILYFLVTRFGVVGAFGQQRIELRLTHKDVAAMVGLTRETTATIMNKLRNKKLISYQSFRYTVHVEKLIAYSGEDELHQMVKG